MNMMRVLLLIAAVISEAALLAAVLGILPRRFHLGVSAAKELCYLPPGGGVPTWP